MKDLQDGLSFDDLRKELNDSGLSLREHQIDGINFMLEKGFRPGSTNHGVILADEMGLGKTCQSVVALRMIFSIKNAANASKLCLPSLVMCPLSVIDHWRQEFRRFGCGKLALVMYRGEKEHRGELRREIEQFRKSGTASVNLVVLTTYELILKDHELLGGRWNVLIVDEAHRLKNPNSILCGTLKQMHFNWTLLLTGTPVQNNLIELYSLLSFVDANRFPVQDVDDFVEKYTKKDKVSELRALLDEYMLRRTKELVCDLPEKREVILSHSLSKLQKEQYLAILARNHGKYGVDAKNIYRMASSSGGSSGKATSLINILSQLRKCTSHPYMFSGVEPEPFEEGEHLVTASGKLTILDGLLKYLKKTGHRALLFSQMTTALDIVQDYLTYRGYTYERLDGSVRSEERFAAVKSFSDENSDTFVFLLSTKAGGLGLTLTAADTVVFLDSDFNPQNDIQAAARVHRIGQDKPVRVIRLVAQHTVEEVVLARAGGKLKLSTAVMGDHENDDTGEASVERLTVDQITEMLAAGLGRLTEEDANKNGNDDHRSQCGHSETVDWASSYNDQFFSRILGTTDSNGHWESPAVSKRLPESQAAADSTASAETAAGGVECTESSTLVDESTSIYYFEGTDYKETMLHQSKQQDRENDLATLNAIIADGAKRKRQKAADDGASSSRRFADVTVVERKPRKPLSNEEKEARKKKRDENAKRRDEEALREEMHREQQRRDRQKQKWAANDYKSCNLAESPLLSDDEEEPVPIDFDSDEKAVECGPFYVLGDVTHPQFRKQHQNSTAIVMHVVDNSGSWGRGGVFDALVGRSPGVEDAYKLAGKMGDLALGDAHFFEIDDWQSRTTGKDYAALIVAQHNKTRDQIDSIPLEKCLSRVAGHVLERTSKSEQTFTVHMPRVGYGMPKVHWYAIERLVKKHFCRKQIPVYIYYFDRNAARRAGDRKRKATDSDQQQQQHKIGSSSNQMTASSSTADSSTTAPTAPLPSLFSGAKIALLVDEKHFAKYQRLIVAFDGEVVDEGGLSVGSSSVTHVVVDKGHRELVKTFCDTLEWSTDCKVVTLQWLDKCIQEMKIVDTAQFLVE